MPSVFDFVFAVFVFVTFSVVFIQGGPYKNRLNHDLFSVVDTKHNKKNRFGSKTYNVSVVTWNLAEKSPNDNDCLFLKCFRSSDLVVLGVQEVEDVRPRRTEGHRSRNWRLLQSKALGNAFSCIALHKMGGLQISMHCKRNISKLIEGVQIIDIACGVGNVLANKGAVCILIRISGKTLAFVNAHLAAHQSKVQQRNNDYNRILKELITKTQKRWLIKSKKSKQKKQIPPKVVSLKTKLVNEKTTDLKVRSLNL